MIERNQDIAFQPVKQRVTYYVDKEMYLVEDTNSLNKVLVLPEKPERAKSWCRNVIHVFGINGSSYDKTI